MKKLATLLIASLLFSRLLSAQTCKVTDFIYLNDPQDYQTQGFVHKLKIGTGGTLTEVPNGLGNMPWFPQGGGLGSPHGLGQDLNGNLYIGANSDTGPIAKITCEGTLVNLNFINDAGFNIVSKDGYLFVNSSSDNRIRRYALCDGSAQGYVTLNGSTQLDWGLFISPNGTFYATTGLDPAFASATGTKAIYRFTPTDADFVNHTSYSPLVSANDVPPGVAAANLPIQSAWLWGITADDAGNMYVIAEDPWFNHQGTTWTGFTWILKYDPNGNLVAWTKDEQTTTPVSGFKGGRGILYYPAKDVLYIAAGQYGDCVAMIKPSDLSYMGAAAGNVPNQNPKTLRIASEACPVNASTKVDTTLCNVKVGDRIFLSQIVGACNAPICGGTWTAAQANVGMTFNQCDLSFTVTGLNGCGKFTLTNVGGTCGDFTIEVNVDFANITASVITGNQTVCAGTDPVAFSESTPATGSGTVSYQWQKSTTSCTTGFTDIAGATNSTYDPPVVSQTTYYRVVTSVVGGCSFPQKKCSDTSNCVTVTVIPAPAFGSLTTSNPTCTGPTANNNGVITLESATNTDKCGISTLGAATYDGPAYASATAYAANKNVKTGIPNTGGTYILRLFNGSNDCYKDTTITIAPVVCCTLPVASATPQKQTICVGGTATAFTATPSTGVDYKWYGPLTSTSGSLGTAISGATNATFTPSGAALTTAGTKYYAVVVNTTGDVACADTAYVQLDVSKITVPTVTALCHANGTPESGTDDYMTFSIHVSTEPMSTNKLTVTATQGGNPLAVTLSNGSAATAINCGLNTPLRTPAGSSGKGNVTLTITDNVTGCSTTLVVTDPGTCAVTCVQGTPSTVTYEYGTQVDITELNSLPIIIPKFDEQGGTRVLQSVKLEYTVGGKTAFVFENRAAQSQSFNAKASSEATLTLNSTDIATNTLEMAIPQTTLPGGVLVPATGSWAGDSIPSPTPTPTTLGRMESWVSDYLTVFKDPRTDARWVTNATGDATDDDDMYLNPMIADSASGTFTYNTALALAPFIGTGNVPLEVSTLSGLALTGGGGNLIYIQRTRAYASAKVTYTFECILCTKPVAVATPKTQTICAGGTATAYTVTPSTGVEYKWYGPLADTTSSLGTAVSGATSATFTPSGVALATAGTKYYAVVVNTTGDVACADTAYVQLVVNAKPTIADGSATICAGESVDLTTKITNYNSYQGQVWTVGTAGGTAVATPSAVKPTGTTTYVLVAQNAAGCKDTANVVVTVNAKPNAGKDTTLACVNAATNTLATSYTLVPSLSGGTWTQLGTTPATATITGNNVTGMSVTGTYQFIYTTTAGCKDTVAVTVAPCAGCVKPNAGPDAANVCQPTKTAKLTAVTAGGTWAPIGSPANPSAATIDASGNISGLNAAGTYKFVYSVTSGGQTCTDTAQVIVLAKPVIADGSATICAGESVDLTSKITNYNTYLSPVWTIGTAGGTAVATPSSVKPTGTTTYVLVAQNAAGCKDTANVVVTVNPKPSAGKDTTLACVNAANNTLATSYTLVPSPTGGSWAQLGTTPTTATITGNNVTGMSVAGTYQFIYTTTAGCKDTVAVTVAPCAGCVKPNAGADAANVCQPTKTAKLTALTAGGTWAAIGSPANPSAATIDASGNISGLNAAGTYKFVYSITSGGQTCTDTAQVIVLAKPVIADGSATICAGESVDLTTKITNYNTYLSPVWTVGTASGTAVATPTSVKPTGTTTYVLVAQNAAGCKDTANVVVTVNAKPSAGKDTTLVCSNGNVPSSVQLSAAPTGGTWSALTGNPTGATVNSAGLVSITNATAQGKSFDFIYSVNGCQDTVKVIIPTCPAPCIKSSISSAAPVCSNDAQTYSFTFTVANKLGTIKVNKGTLTGSNPYTVSGIPSGQNVIITDSLSAICKSDTIIAGVNCNCNPAMPQLLTPSLTVCIGDTFPTLKATVVGLATVEWFSQQTGGAVLFTGLNYKPSGTVTANTIFYAQARSTDPTCPTAVSTSRVPATINAQDCTKEVDLALSKSISKKIAQIGDVLTYTIKVWNESATNATGVSVTDSIATTVQFVSGSFVASRGSASISGNVIKWNIGSISANGDTVTLTYQIKVTQEGVHFNTAEICTTNEKDVDSTPCNHDDTEDDIDRACFTVPVKLCPGEVVEVSIPAKYTNVQWFKNGGTTPVASGNSVLFSDLGSYTFTATNQTCPAEGCCPVIIEAGTNCCPVDLCIPFTIKQTKKAGKKL
ncbi:putative repeat protein (TIGR01451 family) [Runella defluvii]|uniref:Putative repeat protein (TIGR01451 family) n=1 Tax=Runella defluvii TaxID=370973 RepID=A0A7W5ZP20_9BACT|nr:choice-of-anchor E domain-containing protein [Runella defluvii]MBB3839366.1 putative repeat protein (TIGR01451 family) [Runella defluvii]